MCDRTSEFLQCVDRAPGSSTTTVKKRLGEVPKSRTAFHEVASEIARGVHKTSGVLNKLTKLVRRQGLFDDPTDEINNMIFRIKKDLGELNIKCDTAQQFVELKKKESGEKNQLASHNGKVVSQLKTDLMHATKDFKNVLESRASKMKESQHRKVALTGNATVSPMRQFGATAAQSAQKSQNSNIQKFPSSMDGGKDGLSPMPMSSPSPYSHMSGETEVNAGRDYSGNDFSQQQSQQLMFAPLATNQYYESREVAVTEVESTIAELGSLFKRLATMISEQQELVTRIDEDVESAVSTADRAHEILIKTYESMSGNRALYTKIGFLLAIFTLFFVLFLM